MSELIICTDVVELALDYLSSARIAAGDSETRFGGRLANGYERQVIGTLVDSERPSLVVFRSTLRFDCYSDETLGRTEAHDLGQWCRAALFALAGTVQAGTTIYRVLDGPGLSDNPDELTGKARYSFVVVLSTRGTAIPA